MKTRLLTTTAIVGLAFFAVTPAYADCNGGHNVPDNGTVSCDNGSPETNPIVGGNNAGVTVEIGALVNVNGNNAITMGDTGSVTLQSGANVQSDQHGVVMNSGIVDVGASANITGTQSGVVFTTGAGHVTVGASAGITGIGGTAVQFSDTNSTFSMADDSLIGGTVAAGAGTGDQFIFVDNAGTSFDTNDIGVAYTGFEQFVKQGNTTTTLLNNNAQNWRVGAGTLLTSFDSIGDVQVDSGATLRFAGGGNYAGIISGAGGVAKTGGALLTLSGNNTFTGTLAVDGSTTVALANLAALGGTNDIQINQSTLRFNDSMTTGASRVITIGAQDATFDTQANTVTIDGTIQGATGRLTKAGNGTLNLRGTNTYGDGTEFQTGTLNATADNNLGTGNLIFNGGRLQWGASFDTAKNIIVNVGGGTLDTNGFDSTLTGTIAGNFTLDKVGGGTLTMMTDNLGWTGAIGIRGGVVAAMNNASGAGTAIMDGGTFRYLEAYNQVRAFNFASNSTIDTNGFASTISGAISGTGNMTKTGAGTLSLTNNNNAYSGRVILAGGTTAINASINLGVGAGANDTLEFQNGATLRFNNAIGFGRTIALTGDGVFDTNGLNINLTGQLTGAGAFIKNNGGILQLSHANNINTGGIVANAGSISVQLDSNLGGVGNVLTLNNATLQYDDAFNSARNMVMGAGGGTFNTNSHNSNLSGAISGAGGLTKANTGILTLSGTNNYAGRTTISGGTLSVSSTDNLGSGATGNDITIQNGATLTTTGVINSNRGLTLGVGGGVINTGANLTLTGDIDGAGNLRKTGGGTLRLEGTNTFAGTTTVNAGTLSGTTSSLVGNIINDATLVFDQTISGDYNGVIDGVGLLEKRGTGTTTLTNTSTYTGWTTLSGGRLVVNGDISSSLEVRVAAGASLGGTGTVSNLFVYNGGTIAPGNSIGTLNVNGNVTFDPGSIYEVEISPTPDDSDKIAATGNVTINGGTVRVMGSGGAYGQSTLYTIITGAGVTVNTPFAAVSDLAFLDPTLIYNANNVQLQMERNSVTFGSVAHDSGQQAVADALAAINGINAASTAFTGLTSDEARKALDIMSGEHNASLNHSLAQSQNDMIRWLSMYLSAYKNVNKTDNKQALAKADPSVYSAAYFEPNGRNWSDTNMWMQMIGTKGRSDARLTTPEQDRQSYGAIAGVDMPFGNEGRYGLYAGYETTDIDTDSQRASSDIDSYHVGAFATAPVGKGFSVTGGLSATYHTIDTTRNIVFPGINERSTGDTNGYTLSAFGEISRPLNTDYVAVEPFLGFTLTRSAIDGYTEKGSAASLAVGDSEVTNPTTTIGARFGKAYVVDDTKVNLNAMLGWQHTFGTVENSVTSRFAAGNVSFKSYGTPRERDALLLGFGVDAAVGQGTTAFVGYNGAISNDTRDHGVKAGVKVKF